MLLPKEYLNRLNLTQQIITIHRYIRTTHTSEIDRQTPSKIANGKLNSPNYTSKTIISTDDVDRPDVRNLKRVHKMYEGPNIIESRGIVHPVTKEILTVGQAISMRILDVRTGRLLSSPESRQTMTIDQAAREGLIDSKLAARLTGPCGMTEDGNEVTLLEAIQSELYDAEQGLTDPAEKRIKVNVSETKPSTQGMSISDALNEGQVDLERNLYRLPNGTYISISEAYEKGYLIYNEIIKIKSSALSLSDAISQNLVDSSGWIMDRNSGDKFQLDVAIKQELINPNAKEVVDAKNDTHITLTEAISKNIINTKHSKYIHNITKDKLSYKEAAKRRLICKPMTLKDVCDNNIMTNDSKILSQVNKVPLTILQAIKAGVLDSENIKCITNTTTGELLTLSDALASQIILPDGRFRDNLTGELCTIPEAVDRGLITSVSQKSLFDIDGFKDSKTGEFVSFNVASDKGYLKYCNGDTFLKTESGDFVFLEDCTKLSIVRPEVLEMFNRKIGIYDNGKELSVFDAVFKNILDPKAGYLLDSTTKKPISFNKAVEINMITPEGAAMLNCLLNITLNLQTVTKTVKRYVTVTNTGLSHRSETTITFSEAVRRGLIDESSQTFTDPTTGTVFPIQQALDEGLLGVDSNEPRVVNISDRLNKKDLAPGQVVELKITKKSFIKDVPEGSEIKVRYDSKPETVKSSERVSSSLPQELIKEIRTITSATTHPVVTSLKITKNTIELPHGGLNLRDAIQQRLFDPSTGTFNIPGTDRIVSLEEAVKIDLINPDSAKVVDSKSKQLLTLVKALQQKVIDSHGHYIHFPSKFTMQEAIERKLIVFSPSTSPEKSSEKCITVSSTIRTPDKVEFSDSAQLSPSRVVHLSEDQSISEPIQVAPGVIYDPATALVISTSTGASEDVLDAIGSGSVPADNIKIVDPKTSTEITLHQAIDQGVIDTKTGEYKDRSGKKISFSDAAKMGLVVIAGAPLVAASKIIQIVKNTMVIDPGTGEQLPLEVAYERGLVDPVTYSEYEKSLRERTPDQQTKTVSSVKIEQSTSKPISIGAAVSEGFITVESIQSSLTSDIRDISKAETIQREIKSTKPVIIEINKTQLNVAPKYNVNFGHQITTESRVLESKPIVLQKLRKHVITPLEALEKGMIDKDTVKILEAVKVYRDETDSPVTLTKALEIGLVDGNRGKLVDPVHGDTLTVKAALERGILDGDGQDEILIPLVRSLSISEVLDQGLLDPKTGKIIHPETGSKLTLREAIICDIVDPLSAVTIAPGNNVTLQEAIERNIVDNDNNLIKTSEGQLDLITCANSNVFPNTKASGTLFEIPPAAITLPVAIKENLVDPSTSEIKNPLTGKTISLNEAIEKDLIMAIPYPQSSETISVEEALDKGVIDLKNATFTDVATQQIIPLDIALEQGLVAVKPNTQIMQATGVVTTITETFTSQHTITTKMIDILADYVLVNANEVKNLNTGEVISMTEAREKGIVKDEETRKEEFIVTSDNIAFEDALSLGLIDMDKGTFTHPHTGETLSVAEAVSAGILDTSTESKKDSKVERPIEMLDLNQAFEYLFDEKTKKFRDPKSPKKTVSFQEAVDKKIIDPNSVIYDVNAGQPTTVKEAMKSGLLDKKTGKIKEPKSGKSIDIKNAAKMGLIAIVAAPVLAGMAVVEGAKSVASKLSTSNTTDTVKDKQISITNKVENKKEIEKIKHQEKTKDVVDEISYSPQSTPKLVSLENKSTAPDQRQLVATEPKISTKSEPTDKKVVTKTTTISKVGPGSVVTEHTVTTAESTMSYVEIKENETSKSLIITEASTSEGDKIETPDNIKTQDMPRPIDLKISFSESLADGKSKTTSKPKEDLKSGKVENVTSTVSTALPVDERNLMVKSETIPITKDSKTSSALFIDAERQPLRVIDETTEQNITKVQDLPIIFKDIALVDAIEQSKIEPKICRMIINEIESPLTVQDALEQEQISRFTPVDIVSKNCVIIKERKPLFNIAITQLLSPQEMAEVGLYDLEKQIFVSPETGLKITFEELVYGIQVFDPQSILVKDLTSTSDNYVSFDEAMAKPIIDKTTGHMVNPRTGKRIPFFECIQLGWIVNKPDDVEVAEPITIESALEKGLYNPKTGEVVDEVAGLVIPIGNAVEKGLIDNESLLIKLPTSDSVVSLADALEEGLVEISDGFITIIETHEVITITLAIQRGLITVTRRPVSIEAAILNNLYEPKSGKIRDTFTEQFVTIGDAVDMNIVHPTISEIKDTKLDEFVPLSKALDTKLVNPETGKVNDKKTGKYIPLDDALRKGLVSTKSVIYSLPEVIELGYYQPESCTILNPMTGKTETLRHAIQHKVVDPSDVNVKYDTTDSVLPFKEAVNVGLIDLDKGIMTTPLLNLKDASEKGYILSDKKPWTLQEGLVQGIYDPETGLLTINKQVMTLEDAINLGNINKDALTVKNSRSGDIITLSDAIKVGIIDSKEGKAKDPLHGDKISLTDASERGLIVPAKRRLSLPEAVFKGFYDPKTGTFSHPEIKEKIAIDRAIRKHMIDPQSTLVHVAGKVMPFEFAVDSGIVDGRKGTVLLGDQKVDFREAFERGILVEVRKPMSLVEAIGKGIYSEVTGLFMDPQTGKKFTLSEAINMNLIDPHSVHIKDNRLGKWDKITLAESIETGVIDNESGKIKNINHDNEQINLREAFEIGLIVDSKAPITLQRALHQGLYDDKTGKILDPLTGRKITLHEAIRKSVISPKYLCYFDKKSEKPLSLAECCRSEIVDRRNGKFREPGSDVQIPLSEAMSLGLIVDIESLGFTLYETLAMNMYDITELVFIHPVTEQKMSLKEAISNELVNPEISLVKNIPLSKYVKLDDAVQNDIIDQDNSVYNLPNGNKINLVDAKHRGLVVTSKKNLSLEELIKSGLFRADNGKIVDPNTNEFMDIAKAIECGFLNPHSTAVKDNQANKFNPLLLAIEQGNVDVSKGRVLDTKSKKGYSFDIAFDKGLLVTVSLPVTSEQITKRIILDSSSKKEPVLREFTLDEAIKYEFIDPETAVIKDTQKNKYIPLKLGISEGIIDKSVKGMLDPQSGRSRALCVLFENNLIVYIREPLTFEQSIELGHLNIQTARFTEPKSNEVLTLKDAVTLGHIDPDTALIKDNLKKRLVKLPEAYRKGMIDAEKGNILDTETSKLNPLPSAIDSGLLMTPKKSFSLIETLNFGIYNPTTGALNDPFITTSVIDRKRLNLGEAIAQGIVDPSSTVVKEPESGKICPLVQAMEQKLIDPIQGRLITDLQKATSIDLVKAHKKGYLLPAETRVSNLIILVLFFQMKVCFLSILYGVS